MFVPFPFHVPVQAAQAGLVLPVTKQADPQQGHLNSGDQGLGEHSSWLDPLTHPESLICPNLCLLMAL